MKQIQGVLFGAVFEIVQIVPRHRIDTIINGALALPINSGFGEKVEGGEEEEEEEKEEEEEEVVDGWMGGSNIIGIRYTHSDGDIDTHSRSDHMLLKPCAGDCVSMFS